MKTNLNNRIAKISLIFYFLFLCCTLINHVSNELYIERYPSIFLAFIQMNLDKYVSLDYISLIPLLKSTVNVYSDFPANIQRMIAAESYYPNMASLFLIVQYVSNIPPELLLVLPLGVIYLPVSYLALIRSCIPSNGDQFRLIVQYLLFIYMLIFMASDKYYGSFYVAPPAFTLIFISVLLLKKRFETKYSYSLSILLLICMFSLIHYWHTAFLIYFFIVASFFLVVVFLYLIAALFSDTLQLENFQLLFQKSTFLFLTLSVFFLAFTHLWQSGYIKIFLSDAALGDFLTKLILKFHGEVAFPIPYAFNYKDSFYGALYFKSFLLIYAISAIIFLIPIYLLITNIKHDKAVFTKLPFVITSSIFLAQILMVFVYYKTKSISFIYVPLFFPLLGAYLFLEIQGNFLKRISFYKHALIILLVLITIFSLLCLACVSLTNECGMTSVTKYHDTKPNFEWLYHKMNFNNPVIVDFNILGKYIKRESMLSKPRINYVDLDSNIYGVLVGDNNLSANLYKSYIIIDEATMQKGLPIQIKSSRGALNPLPTLIDECKSQNKIYSDNSISIYFF
ncbi:hypothetical protein [Methanosarcina barkeri]|uniref:Glycosyltransferase RgtA/B/C/D-like domain-containing protein n=1 Tax=Methanosarcina barkeri 227 TaxID=1434106 RepID=A0A0E3R3L2_METBA|nr:hypothetical protein [Methanosarcina barkeri]AKB58119.1 hypothetical protein MSBR2_1603 [Methanosarcina barkeri 227]